MPTCAYDVSSLEVLGIDKFRVPGNVMYLNEIERAVLSCQQMGVPVEREEGYGGFPHSVEELVVEGVDWFPSELRVLEHYIKLLGEISPQGEKDPVFQLYSDGTLEIHPMAYPIVFVAPSGERAPGLGNCNTARKHVLMLRSFLIWRPVEFMATLYHEGWHGSGEESEVVAHQKQLDFLGAMIPWLNGLTASSAPQANVRASFVQQAEGMVERVQMALARLS